MGLATHSQRDRGVEWSGVEWRLQDLPVRDLVNDPREFVGEFTSNDVSRWR